MRGVRSAGWIIRSEVQYRRCIGYYEKYAKLVLMMRVPVVVGVVGLFLGQTAHASTIFSFVAGSEATAGQFGILAGSNSVGSLVFQESNENWAAQSGTLLVGIGNGTSVTFSGPGTFNGKLLFEEATPAHTPSYSNFSPTQGDDFGSNSSAAGVLSVYNAITDATLISNRALWNATAVTAYSGGNITVSGGGTHYYSVSSNLNTGAITITGGANDIVVVNVTGNAQLAFTGVVTLAGGLTADNVLFNFTGTSKFQGNNNGGYLPVDIIIASSVGANVDHTNFQGRVFDIATSGSLQLASGFNINAPAALTAAPEPTPIALSMLGLALVAVTRRRKLRKT